MRQLLSSPDLFDARFYSGKLMTLTIGLVGNHTIDADGPIGHFINPGATPRDVILPLVDEGLFFFIANQGSANLTIKSASGTTVTVLEPGISNVVLTDGQSWVRLVAATSTFGPVGPSHSSGLVPDPGPTPGPAVRFLGDDGAWHGALGGSLLDGYSFITDGTHIAAGTGNDTFKLRTSAKLTVVVTDNDATHGDNALFDVVEAQVNHDALLNFVANKHIDHTAVSISAGSGLTGGGDISASRSLALNFGGLGAQAPVIGDTFAFLNTATHFKATFSQLNSILVHNSLSGYVANEHINHTSVSITAGTGLSGGGDISASRTLNMNIAGLSALVGGLAAGDEFVINDVSGPSHVKVTFSVLNSNLDHNALTNFVANKHIDHSTVTVTGTGALTGGGDLTASRTIDVASAGITFAKMQNIATDSLIGRDTAASGAPENILLNSTLEMDGAGNLRRAALTGDVTASAGSNATSIPNNTVTYAKMQDVSATSRVLGRITAGAGDPEELTGTDVRTITGLATTDTPQFAGVEVGNASDTTLARLSAGDISVEGNRVFRVGGTDVPVADGGTGSSNAENALSMANLGAYRMLGASAVANTLTGTTTETVLATVTVPANAMGANGRIRVFSLASMNNNANNKQLRVRFGGLSGTLMMVTTQTTNLSVFSIKEWANRNATNSQILSPNVQNVVGAQANAVSTGAVDTTVAQDVVITGQLANSADTITLESYTVEILKQA